MANATARPAYTIQEEGGDLVIRLKRDAFSHDSIAKLLDYLILQDFSDGSGLSDDQVTELADEVDRAVWERLRPMVEKKLDRSIESPS